MKEIPVARTLESEIIDSYRLFIKYYHQDRDLDSLQTLFSSHITYIGSETDQINPDYESVLEVFKKDIDHCPESVDYSEKLLNVNIIKPDVGLLIAHFDTRRCIKEIPFANTDQKFSVLWQKIDQQWLIVHIHLSKSESGPKKGDSLPLSELQEKNLTLEKLVNRRTRELCKTTIDLSEAHKEIIDIKQQFETIFERTSDGIIVADWKNHQFFMINPVMCNILGYNSHQMQRFWLDDLIPEEQLNLSMDKIIQQANGEIPIADNIPLKCANQKIRYFDITSQQIKIKRAIYLISLFRDITDQNKTLQISQQAEIAQKASEAKNLFLANMSHEIRTPVTGIMGMSEILTKTELNPQQTEYLNIIRESSKILLTLINDILDISKIEAGKMALRPSVFKLGELIKNIKILTQPGLINSNNKLEVILEKNVPEFLNTDKMRLEQVLMNLINNAIKFTKNGTITLRIEKTDAKGKNMLKVLLTDTGLGISPESQDKLFQKFQQIDTPLTPPADGSGLGLYICRQLVTLMEGNIGVYSTPGKGSTFWFTFKSKGMLNEWVYSEDEDEFTAEVPLNLNVLLVDDKRVNLQVISIMLQGANCTIETANNGLEALEKFKPEKHDVVLMDIMMPLMDGLTAMKEIRKKHQNLRPIIAITANAMCGDKEKYLAEGFDAYITKPLTMQKLTSELLQLGLMKHN